MNILRKLFNVYVVVFWVVVALLLLLLGMGNANAFRCNDGNGNNYIVKKGDYHFEVLRKCGKPDYFNSVGGIQSDVEIMAYYNDEAGARTILTFRMGRLESETLDRTGL